MHIVQTLRSLVKPTWHKLPVGKLQRTVRNPQTTKDIPEFGAFINSCFLRHRLGFRVCSKDLSPLNTTSTAKQKASALAHHQAKGLKEITTSKTVKNQVQLLYLLLNQDTVYSIFRSELQGHHWSLDQSLVKTPPAEATSQHPRVGAFWRWQSNGETLPLFSHLELSLQYKQCTVSPKIHPYYTFALLNLITPPKTMLFNRCFRFKWFMLCPDQIKFY